MGLGAEIGASGSDTLDGRLGWAAQHHLHPPSWGWEQLSGQTLTDIGDWYCQNKNTGIGNSEVTIGVPALHDLQNVLGPNNGRE